MATAVVKVEQISSPKPLPLASRWQAFEFKKLAPPPSASVPPTLISISASRKKPLPTVESSTSYLTPSANKFKVHQNRKVISISPNVPISELLQTVSPHNSVHLDINQNVYSKISFKNRANMHPAFELKELKEKKDINSSQKNENASDISEQSSSQVAEYIEYVPIEEENEVNNQQNQKKNILGNSALQDKLNEIKFAYDAKFQNNPQLIEEYNIAASKIQAIFRIRAAKKIADRLRKRRKDREYCAKELLSTERTYVESLNVLREIYLIPLQENLKEPKPLITQAQYKLFFGHLETIMNVNKMFLMGCEKVLSNYSADTLISPLFHGYTHLFKSYTAYCNNFEAANSAIKQLKLSSPEFAAWIKVRDKDSRTNRLGMQSYLILPIQRIPRYRLLLQDLLKQTDPSHKDYQGLQKCLGEILSVAEHLNSTMKQIEASMQLLNIQSQFQNLPDNFEIQAPWRTFLKEGAFRVLPDYQPIHLHLFNDIIVFSKKGKSQFSFRSKAELGHTKIYDYKYNQTVENPENRFKIKSLNLEMELVCNQDTEKIEWLKLIHEQIEQAGGGSKLNVNVDTKNEKSTFLEALSDDIGEDLDPEECLEEMKTKGATMLKYCRTGKPHFRHFILSSDEKKVCWGSKNKRTADSKVLLARVTDLKTGQTTDLFKKYLNPDVENVSMSLLYGKGRSLDLVASDKKEFAIWLTGLRFLLQNGPRANAGDGATSNENLIKTIEKSKFDHKFQEIGDSYTWGQNNRGSLGHDNQDDQPIPLVMKDFLYLDVMGLYCSDSVAFGVMTNGALFSWGSGKDGRTGHGDEIDRLKPTRVDALRGLKVNRVAIGSTHALVLLNDGSIYSFGTGEYGQLGCGDIKTQFQPKKVESVLENHKVQFIACGAMHCAAITNNGEMYTWGKGEDGQLGIGTKENQFIPTVVHTLHNESIVTCALGMWHTMALTREGRVYVWGDTTYGQCGLGKQAQQAKSQPVPIVIPLDLLPRKILSLAAGSSHSGAIADDGSIWMWGNGMYGQLGVGEKENSPVPLCVRDLQHEKAIQITCGVNHTMILTESNDVYSWGAGTYGRLGIREEKDQPLPRLIEFLREKEVREVSAGGCMSACVCGHQWVPDLDAKKCMNCNRDFTIIRRRHHCRYCGGLFCGACSSKRVTLLRFGFDNRVRVCDTCFQILKRESGAQGSN